MLQLIYVMAVLVDVLTDTVVNELCSTEMRHLVDILLTMKKNSPSMTTSGLPILPIRSPNYCNKALHFNSVILSQSPLLYCYVCNKLNFSNSENERVVILLGIFVCWVCGFATIFMQL